MSLTLELDVVQTLKYVILDTDMGTDDVWALVLLLKAQKYFSNIKLLAITCVHGNTSMDNVINNSFAVLDLMNRPDIPVYKGASEALIGGDPINIHFNGSNGLGGINIASYTEDSNVNERLQPQSAVEIIHKLVMERPHEVSLICIGPLTNLALALKTYDSLRDNMKEVYLMGGNSSGIGNVSSCAEYNFYLDPEAAHIVLETVKCPITILPWEPCLGENIKISMEWRFEIVKDITCRCIELLNEAEKICYRNWNEWVPVDGFLIAAFLFPKLSVNKTRQLHATVELSGKHTRGQMVLDHLKRRTSNVTIIDLLNEEGCKKIFQWTATS